MNALRSRALLLGLLVFAPLFALSGADPAWLSLLGAVPPLAALGFSGLGWFYAATTLAFGVTALVGFEMIRVAGVLPAQLAATANLLLLGAFALASRRFMKKRELEAHRQRQWLEDIEDELAASTEKVMEGESALARSDNKHKRYSRLQEAATLFASTLDLERLADLILAQTAEVLQDKPVSLTLFVFEGGDADKELLRKNAGSGPGAYEASKTASADPLNQWVISRGTTLIIRDLEKDFRFRGLETKGMLAKCFYISPLLSPQGQVTGLVRVEASQKDSLDTEDQRLLESLVVLASLAAENVKLYRETQDLAVTDGLTKLLLRRPLIERLEDEMSRAVQTETPLVFILADIDHFKAVNDTYGHPVGDQVLRDIAALMKKCVRDVDLCGRYGGEEFAVLLPATDLKGAKVVAERIREGVKARPFDLRGEQKVITLSLGVAVCPTDATQVEDLIQKADEALYRSKEAGRDRVTVFGEM
jgi:diguanylate cyclase (GGDEF)-like protein